MNKDREEFKRLLKEQELFDELKDSYITCQKLRSRCCDLDINYGRLYRRIANYKVKKYGSSFQSRPDYGIFKTHEEIKRLSNRSRNRKKWRIKGGN